MLTANNVSFDPPGNRWSVDILFLRCYHAVSVFWYRSGHTELCSWQLLHIVATQSFLRALETFGHACSNQQQANSREIPDKQFSQAFTKLFSISTRVSFDTHQIVVLSQTGVVVRLIESCLPAILLNSPQLTGYSCC